MQAVILTGGLGTRLRPLTYRVPKGMVPVEGRPFLEYLLLYLKQFEVEKVLFCTGWLGKRIEEHFQAGDRLGLRIEYSREEKPLGTGGALKRALPRLEKEFFLLNGDTLIPGDWSRFRRRFSDFSGSLLLSLVPARPLLAPANSRLGLDGFISGYSKTSADSTYGHIDAGLSLSRRSIARHFPDQEKFSLEEHVYPVLISSRGLGGFAIADIYYDIGTPEGLESFRNYIRENRSAEWLKA